MHNTRNVVHCWFFVTHATIFILYDLRICGFADTIKCSMSNLITSRVEAPQTLDQHIAGVVGNICCDCSRRIKTDPRADPNKNVYHQQ